MENKWTQIPSDEIIQRTQDALAKNGIESVVVASGQEAFAKVFEILPLGANVMNMTSVTLQSTGIEKEIMESGKYDSVRNKLANMDRSTQGHEMQMMSAAPVWTIGSVHAITQLGQVIVASNSGSQLPSYAYGSDNVIWVAGAHKIVTDIQDGMQRIYEYTLPLESARAHKAYGVDASNVSKLLIFNKEPKLGRITLVIVKEALGF